MYQYNREGTSSVSFIERSFLSCYLFGAFIVGVLLYMMPTWVEVVVGCLMRKSGERSLI